MQVRGVDFILLGVSDVERARAFYQDTLGLTPGAEWPPSWYEFDAGSTTQVEVNAVNGSIDAVMRVCGYRRSRRSVKVVLRSAGSWPCSCPRRVERRDRAGRSALLTAHW